jgi:hypothetical protein
MVMSPDNFFAAPSRRQAEQAGKLQLRNKKRFYLRLMKQRSVFGQSRGRAPRFGAND